MMAYNTYILGSYATGITLIGGLVLHTLWQWRTTTRRLRTRLAAEAEA